jgi:hypothetical protein
VSKYDRMQYLVATINPSYTPGFLYWTMRKTLSSSPYLFLDFIKGLDDLHSEASISWMKFQEENDGCRRGSGYDLLSIVP